MRRSRPRTPASRVYSRITRRSASSEIVELLGRQAVRLDLLRHEVALRDAELLVLGVAGERDHSMRSSSGPGIVSTVFAVQMNRTFDRSNGRSR